MTTSRSPLALLVLAGVLAGCDPPAALEIPLPGGLPVQDLPEAQRALLRATLEVKDGALAETDVSFDVDALTIRGDFALQNVEVAGERAMTLRVYGRFDADAGEVLLGAIDSTLEVTPNAETRVSFAGLSFETCGAGLADAPCAVAFDDNRNKKSNLLDLLPVAAGGAGIDPAAQAPFVDVSPSTLQFPSGIRLGTFARQVIVLENRGPHPMRVVKAEVVGGQGTALSLFDPTGVNVAAPRRSLDDGAFAGEGDGLIAPSDEAFIAVSFAPVNSFLTTGAVHVTVEDAVTLVRQTARVKVIANADGALRPPAPDYAPPDLDTLALGDDSVDVVPFPTSELFSGLAVTGAALSAGGLAATGAVAVVDRDGAAVAIPVDAAFAVDVPAGHRFATSLGGLGADVDLAVLTVDGDAVAGLACAACVSSNAGTSPEGVELTNDGAAPLRVVIVLGRIDGAARAAPALLDFDLTAQITQGPEFDDAAPVAPASGPLEGGVTVTLRGRGFDPRATVLFAESLALDVSVTTDESGASLVTLTLPPGSLEVGKNPATIVVANPSVEDGGDGQAATLPEGFGYQPPAPRLTSISPSFATTTGGLPIVLEGAFFSTRAGPPVVTFGAIEVTAVFLSATRISVIAPALPADLQGAPQSVAVNVRNRLAPEPGQAEGALGAPSNAREFRFVVPVGPAPTVSSVSPAQATIDGGEDVVVTGAGFREGASVIVGGVNAVTLAPTADGTQLSFTAPPRVEAGLVDLLVVNADGQSATLPQAFTYAIPAPTVTAVFPDRASTTGGTLLVVTGTGFREGAAVRFERDGVSTAAASVNRVSNTSLLVLTPAATAGTSTLVVENVDDQTASVDDFEIFQPAGDPPAIIGVDPATGDVGGGYAVTIFGDDFQTPSVVFGGVLISGDALSVVDGGSGDFDRISFTAPASSTGLGGVVAVQVVNGDQQSDSATFAYIVAPASPRIDAVTPGRVSTATPTPVVVRGANLGDVVSVFAGGAPVSFSVVSTVEVQATVPASPEGPLSLSVQTATGKVATTTIDVTGPPQVLGLSASSVHAGVAGDRVLLFGTNLDAAAILGADLQTAPGVVAQANVLVVDEAFVLVEVPRVAAATDARFVLRYAGGVTAASPPFATRAPLVIDVDVGAADAFGRVTLTLAGVFLHADRLTEVTLTRAGADVACAAQVKTESSITCVTDSALEAAGSYGLTLEYLEELAGTQATVLVPLPFSCTSAGCVQQ